MIQIIGKPLKRELMSSEDEISGLLSNLAAEGVPGWEAVSAFQTTSLPIEKKGREQVALAGSNVIFGFTQ
jgi:hypothetical protein